MTLPRRRDQPPARPAPAKRSLPGSSGVSLAALSFSIEASKESSSESWLFSSLRKPGVEVLRSRVCAATGQIAAPGHRPDRLPVGLCIGESSPTRYPVTRGCLKVTPLLIQAYNGDRHRTPSWSLNASHKRRPQVWAATGKAIRPLAQERKRLRKADVRAPC